MTSDVVSILRSRMKLIVEPKRLRRFRPWALKGSLLASTTLATSLASLSTPVQASPYTEGAKTVLFMRVDFSDKPGDPVSIAAAQQLINTDVNNAYIENSYGKTSLSTTVTPTLRMPHPSTYYTDADDSTQLLVDARAAALAAGYNTNNYDRDICGFTSLPFDYGGLGYVGSKGTWINGEFDFRVTAHELGHNTGLWHANLWQTTDGSVIGAGANNEYADVYDIMGANWDNSSQLHFNTWFKNRVDWLTTSNVQSVASSGTYRIYAQDTTAGSGMRAIKIVKDGTKNYWVEYRQKITGNSNLTNGALVHWGYNTNTGSHLLDMTPATSGNATDAPLQLNQTFTDASAGISIKPVATGGSAPKWMDVQVTMNATGPANDGFSNAQGVADMSGSTTGTNVGATVESGEPAHVFGPYHSVWYRWTAPASGAATFNTAGSDYDTTLAVYTGSSVNALTQVAANDDADYSTLQSQVNFSATAGTTYYIAVDGYGGYTGNIALNWTEVNDNYSNAAVLTGSYATASGTNVGATIQSAEPAHYYGPYHSVWYRWTAPNSTPVFINTKGSDFDTMLAVYTGSDVAALTPVVSNDDFGAYLTSQVNFTPVAGTTYSIAVDGFAGHTGNIALTLDGALSLTSFSPASGAVGTVVTINGSGFSAGTSVAFNGTPATAVTVVSATQIKATVPSGALTGTITLTNSGSSASSVTAFKVTPKILNFSPSSGGTGTVVTLNGTTFDGATAVKFGAVAASFSQVSSTQITATVPANAITGKIAVTTPAGTGSSATNFTVTSPALTRFTPTTGPAGTVVTLTGALFTNPSVVRFNGIAATSVTYVSPTQLTAVVPVDALTGPISVTPTSGLTATNSTIFKVLPTITGFSPAAGPVGTSVTINGSGFNGATAVKLGSTSVSFSASPTQITFTVPSNGVTGKLSVTTPGGTATTSDNFVVFARIASFSPSSAAVGALVTINGANFTNPMTVKFNGVPSSSVTFVSSTKLTATVPAEATTGLISVATAGGQTASSATSFKVLPTITSFSPSSGPVGTSVVLTGTGFNGTTAVKFGTLSATNFVVNSSTQITVVVPVGAVSNKISVTTPGGTVTTTTNFVVTAALGASSLKSF